MLRETVKELRKNYPYYCPHCRENIKFETLKRLNENNISLQRIKSKPPYYRRSMQDSNLHTDDDKLNLNGG